MQYLRRYFQPTLLIAAALTWVIGMSALVFQIFDRYTRVDGWVGFVIAAGWLTVGILLWAPRKVEVKR